MGIWLLLTRLGGQGFASKLPQRKRKLCFVTLLASKPQAWEPEEVHQPRELGDNWANCEASPKVLQKPGAPRTEVPDSGEVVGQLHLRLGNKWSQERAVMGRQRHTYRGTHRERHVHAHTHTD